MQTLLQDLRHAGRTLLRQPGYLATALLTLALGIGFSTAMFSVVNAVLLRPLPYADPDRLLQLRERNLPRFPEFSVSPGHYLAWKEQTTVFEGIAAWRSGSIALSHGTGTVDRVRADRVTWDLFPLLGVEPVLGRGFVEADDRHGAPRVLVLSHEAWQNRFGGRGDVVGLTVRVDAAPATIVGVMPAGFTFASSEVALWMPMAFTEAERQSLGSHFIGAIARTRPGVTLDRAREDLNVVARRLAETSPDTSAGWEVLAFPLHEYAVRQARTPLLVLLGAVAVVLLIACVNVANLLLAHGAARQRELAIRAAIGATRRRLVRQLLVEQTVVGCLSTALGVLLAAWLLRGLIAVLPGALPRQEDIGLDLYVLAFACGLAFATPLLSGLFPAIQATRIDLRDLIAMGGRGSTHRASRVRRALVVVEIAFAMMLLVGAGLLLRSFQRLSDVTPGFEPDQAVIASIALPTVRYTSSESREQLYARLLADVSALPQVQSAGVSQSLPMVNDYVASVEIEGASVNPRERPTANFYAVSSGYLAAMRIPVVRGRAFTAADGRDARRPVIVNESLARLVGGDPLGRRIRIYQGPGDHWREIVGVVADVKQYGLADRTTFQVYEPYERHLYLSAYTLVARTRGRDATAIVPDLRAIVAALDADLPVARVRTLDDVVSASIRPQRFSTLLIGLFGATALVLALIGVYGVIAYAVNLRRQEFAIRAAHGARPADILLLVLRGAAAMSLAGIVLGLAAAWLLRGFVQTLLFEVSTEDPSTYALVAALLGATAFAASAVPTLRASRVDPAEALRGN